ncbi:MAG: tetratricopeptide repeat-containing sulfotransferase family protein [Phycisphaerales bacterium]
MAAVSAAAIEQMIRQAQGLAARGGMREASRTLQDAVTLAPRSAEAHAALGWVLHQLGEPLRAADALKKSAALNGTRAETHYLLGTVQQVTGDIDGAIKSFERAMALKPSMPDPYGGASSLYERSSQPAKARQVIERGLKHVPKDAQLRAIHAGMRLRDGEAEGAKADLQKLIAQTNPEDVPALVRAWHNMGQTLDKLGEFDASFAAFARCNQLRETMPQAVWALQNDNVTGFIRAQRSITKEQCERWAKEEPQDGLPSPAFLVGFPRSGTTLIEQVLGAHPKVVATPERHMLLFPQAMLEQLARAGGGAAADDAAVVACLDALTPDHLRALRAEYWKHAEREIGGAGAGAGGAEAGGAGAGAGGAGKQEPIGDRLLVDKYPVHVGRLGLINRLFPRAKVMVALRDPRDCCLSAFMQYFQHNPAMVKFLRLDTTARFYAELIGLYLELRDRLTTPLLAFRYEDVVADAEGQARSLLNFLELEWDEKVLSPEERAKSRYVNTPSWNATSSKINAGAKGRWTKYRKHLEPILGELEGFVKEFGYVPSFEPGSAEVPS